MKKIRLLAPLLGLTTVATVVMPMATSCTNNGTESNKHVTTTAVTVKDISTDGVAQYLLKLDSSDYEATGFTVKAKVSDKDMTSLKDSDLHTDFSLDGNHLVVDVSYVGSEEPEEEVQCRLDIEVKYGTQWTEKVEVRFNYNPVKGVLLTYDPITRKRTGFESEVIEITTTQTYKFILPYSEVTKRVDVPRSFGLLESGKGEVSVVISSAKLYKNSNVEKATVIKLEERTTYFNFDFATIMGSSPLSTDYLTFEVVVAKYNAPTVKEKINQGFYAN